MSVKSRLRSLDTAVEWLTNVGRYRRWAEMIDIADRKQELSDHLARNPWAVERYDADFLDALNLPPPRVKAAPAPEPAPRPEPMPEPSPEPAPPHPEERRVAARLEGSEPAPRAQPILLGVSSASARKRLDASLRSAPQDEGVRVEPPPEPESAPPPFNYDPPPEMQIRPVFWRQRGPQDYEDDSDDMYGKCIVDYDPLGYLDTDDD